MDQIEAQMGIAKLDRSDGIVQTLRYDSESCRLFFLILEQTLKELNILNLEIHMANYLTQKNL